MEIKKKIESETKIQAWVVKHEGKYYRVSQGIRPRRPMETFIHDCIVTGKINWKTAKELFCTRTLDVTAAFNEYLASIAPQVETPEAE